MAEVKNDRCIICGVKRDPSEINLDPRPLCGWCGADSFYNNLNNFLSLVEEDIVASGISYRDIPSQALVTDLGVLGAEHPYLKYVRRMIGILLSEAIGKGWTDPRKLFGVAATRHIAPPLTLLAKDLSLIGIETENNVLKRIVVPRDSLLHKVAAAKAADPKGETRAPGFALGYVTLKSVKGALDIIKERGTLRIGEWVTKLYLIDYIKEEIKIPKFYTAALALIFGKWAFDVKDVSEKEIKGFLSVRGITGKDYNVIISYLTGDVDIVLQQLFKPKLQPDGWYNFEFNDLYLRLRERLRERERERKG
jgi:hypothetical protein